MAISLARFVEQLKEDLKTLDFKGIDVETEVEYAPDESGSTLFVIGKPTVKLSLQKSASGKITVYSYMFTGEVADEDEDLV